MLFEKEKEWYSLDEILQSALSNVIQADAEFQLKQAEAWSDFSQNIRTLGSNPLLQTLDFSVGFGRLENLAMQEVEISLDLDIYKPGLLKRTWWGVLGLFGLKRKAKGKMYRIGQPADNNLNRLELKFKVRRNENGTWGVKEANDNSLTSETAVV